jgi:hypothetical protein
MLEQAVTRALTEIGLIKVIIKKHRTWGPPTFQLGRHPIHGIFVTPALRGNPCASIESEPWFVGANTQSNSGR